MSETEAGTKTKIWLSVETEQKRIVTTIVDDQFATGGLVYFGGPAVQKNERKNGESIAHFLTVEQVAEVLQLSRSKVYQLIDHGLIAHRIGGSIRISSNDLSEFLKQCRGEPEKPQSASRTRLKHLKLKQ